MKKFFAKITDLLEAMAQARAASMLVRMGQIEKAKNLYR